MLNRSLRGNPTDPTVHSQLTCDEQLPIRLHRHVQRLQLIRPVISVSVLALRQQHAELEEDIALVLSRHAGDPLDVEVDQLEALLNTMESQRITRSDAPNPAEDDGPVPGEEVRR
jgi:hypothetical protein